MSEWTTENDQKLINFVRDHEILYNVKSKDFRKPHLKQHLWDNIGTVLGKGGADCCKRWSYIRDYYNRSKKRLNNVLVGESTKNRSALLSFLDNIPSSQENIITNVVEITDYTPSDTEENTIDIDDTEYNKKDNKNMDENMIDKEKKKVIKLAYSEERSQIKKSRAAEQNETTTPNELDETDLFFNSISKIVKKLPRHEQVQVRMQISLLVGNAELRSMLTTESGQPNDSTISNIILNNTLPELNDIFHKKKSNIE